MSNLLDTKTCKDCKQEKITAEFYFTNKTRGWLTSYCKECSRKRAKSRPPVNYKVATIESEKLVIERLGEYGIPALPGKALHQEWCDVIAWGCVLIEVKSSHFIDNHFHFSFSENQRTVKLRGDLVVLVCNWESKTTFHVFSSNHAMLYNRKGQLKTAIQWTPDRSSMGPASPLTDKMMETAGDYWNLVEQYRNRIQAKIAAGYRLPIRLNEAA